MPLMMSYWRNTVKFHPTIRFHFPFFLALLLLLGGCAPLIGPYSPIAYKNATDLKAEALALMGKATHPYAQHSAAVDQLFVKLDQAYEFVKGIPSNSISARQWKILIDPNGDLIGKFFLRWRERSTLSPTFIRNFKKLVEDAFDEIICLETNKKEASRCNKQTKNEK